MMRHYDHKQSPDSSEACPVTLSECLESESQSRIIESVLPYTKIMNCRKGMEVIIGGMESAGFYFLRQGAIEVSYISHDTRIVVALIGSGKFFGESGFFDGSSRIRDIRAIDDAEILLFDIGSLTTLQTRNPVLYGNLMMTVARSLSMKFRRVLEDREPMTVYASSLSTGRRSMTQTDPPHDHFLISPEGVIVQSQVESFKSKLFDLSCELQKDTAPDIPDALKLKGNDLFNEFNDLLEGFRAKDLAPESATALWQYVFKESFPYVMRSRIAERSYFKPKGYAGDFLTIEMLYNNIPDGDGKIGSLVDAWCLDSSAARAVRARRTLLTRQLEALSRDNLAKGNTVSIMNLACGPSRELADFLEGCAESELIRALCVDIDPDALTYANKVLSSIQHRAEISLMQENLIKWCLGKVDHDFAPQDIIYSSGLMDYLDDGLFKAMINRCYTQLKPSGVLMLGNFSPANSIRMFMDHILDWKLIHRNENDLLRLFDNTPFENNVTIIGEDQGINLFAVAVRHE